MPWKPEFQSYLVQNLKKSIPHPNDASDKIWLRLAHWLRRYLSLKMLTDPRTHARTPDRPVLLKKQKLTLFYKMVNNLTPIYLSSLIPSTVTETSRYDIAHANDTRRGCKSMSVFLLLLTFNYSRMEHSSRTAKKLFNYHLF